jgi:hypothetical protein
MSCSSDDKFKINDPDEIKGVFTYLQKDLDMNQTSSNQENFSVIYLILSECNCVYDNIDFVKKYISKNDKNLILIVKPDKSQEYVNEMKELSLLTNTNFRLIIDNENDFLKHGNFYVSDKYFLIKNFKTIFKLELKKENFLEIEKIAEHKKNV